MDSQLKKFRDYIQRVQDETELTPTQIARRAGLAATTVTRPVYRPEDAHAPSMRTISKIVNATGISFEYETDRRSVRVLAPGDGAEACHSPLQSAGQNWSYSLPVYQMDVVAPGGDLAVPSPVEGYCLREESVEYCRRPPGLDGVPDAYGVYVARQVLHRYPQGEAVLLAPSRPVRQHDVVFLRVQDAHDDHAVCYMGMLREETAESVAIEMELPQSMDVAFARSSVKAMHKVLTTRELIGL